MDILDQINNPKDIKKLTIKELEKLAVEVRKRILQVTARTGGHVAPSLGATDLTIALLKVFNPLCDRIVWDVGHQAYAYKILTERNNSFDTLRQLNGISGFNNIFESKYDAFGVGHSSTSISAALGIAVAKDLQNSKGNTIAIIGDGALTAGIAFEGLNNAGHLQKNLIVVLNDNNMSISPNVGALQAYLANILVSRSYNALKAKIWELFQHFPKRIRRRLIAVAQKFEENLINFFVPNVIFEDLGFKYVGPIDGHDIGRLVKIFYQVKRNMVGPVLVHVVTTKGKGYEFAEDDAPRFHGLGPFEVATGKCVAGKGMSYSTHLGNILCDVAARNKRIVAITAAMADGTGLVGFSQKFPERFFDVGICEQHAVTFAGGLAVQGLKPFVVIYSTFLQRAYDQIIHDIALQKLPVVFCLDRAGLVGEDGATHHGAFDLSYLNLIPNLVIMAPADANELTAMVKFAARYKQGPVAIRYPRGNALFCTRKLSPLELGKFDVVHPDGKILMMGIGHAFNDAVIVREKLQQKFPRRSIALVNGRFMKPLDTDYLESIKGQIDYIFTLEENSLIGGFGNQIKDFFSTSRTRVYSFGLPDKFITHGKVEELKTIINLDPESICRQIEKILIPS
ncbi:MAG: 1-deoxy-D-xylulose-5-phosphate synthase [Candidatus Cloacimonetes bacterium]|nr:1-deoxy-D-xylulose-5-phosphate synthase [Candidatus Cloacimonadota bacterium]